MTIAFLCKNCQTKLKVANEKAGQAGSCPKCKAKITVPTPAKKQSSDSTPASAKPATPPPANPKMIFKERLANSFNGEIQPSKPSFFYVFSMLLVALVMVMLPLLYIAFIGLVGYSIFWHLATNHTMLEYARGRGAFLVFLLYIAPLPCGLIAILFMFKPLFARPARDARGRSLTEQSDPLLFEFVAQICEKVGAPFPKRIDVDYQMNASASFKSGFWSIFKANDLVLTIGAPLAYGMSVRSFAGVLAHEFGHFSQGAGMRLSYIIRVISHWFTRVVYERDEWDEWLVMTSMEMENAFGLVLHIARLFVWLSRQILFILMLIGHFVSGILLRQMEYDADYYETQLAGSAEFAVTSYRLQTLGAAYSIAGDQLYDRWLNGDYMDDLTQFTKYWESKMPDDVKKKIEEHMQEGRTGIFDTHPCDRDRIAKAESYETPGIFHVNGEATNLFSDFNKLSKNVTWDLYCEIANKRIDPTKLRPTSQIISLYEQGGEQRSEMTREDLPKLSLD